MAADTIGILISGRLARIFMVLPLSSAFPGRRIFLAISHAGFDDYRCFYRGLADDNAILSHRPPRHYCFIIFGISHYEIRLSYDDI